jgi:hypothetical protein
LVQSVADSKGQDVLDLQCLALQGRADGLRFDWESFESHDLPADLPRDVDIRDLPAPYVISVSAPRLLLPGRPLAWELQELEAFMTQPINVPRGTLPISHISFDTDFKGKLHMYMGFLLLHEGIKVFTHTLVASSVLDVRANNNSYICLQCVCAYAGLHKGV